MKIDWARTEGVAFGSGSRPPFPRSSCLLLLLLASVRSNHSSLATPDRGRGDRRRVPPSPAAEHNHSYQGRIAPISLNEIIGNVR